MCVCVQSGDIIRVLDQVAGDGWWYGVCLQDVEQKEGLFPADFVHLVSHWVSASNFFSGTVFASEIGNFQCFTRSDGIWRPIFINFGS